MKNKIVPLMFILGVLLVGLSGVAYASDDEPLWFLSLEYIGIAIGIYAIVVTYKNYKLMKEGKIGKASKFTLFAIVAIALAFAWRAVLEARHIEGLFAEVIFEVLLYTAVILIILSSKKLTTIMGNKK